MLPKNYDLSVGQISLTWAMTLSTHSRLPYVLRPTMTYEPAIEIISVLDEVIVDDVIRIS